MCCRRYMYGADAMDSTAGVPAGEIALLLARFACNNHTICDDELRAIGANTLVCDPLVLVLAMQLCFFFRSIFAVMPGRGDDCVEKLDERGTDRLQHSRWNLRTFELRPVICGRCGVIPDWRPDQSQPRLQFSAIL